VSLYGYPRDIPPTPDDEFDAYPAALPTSGVVAHARVPQPRPEDPPADESLWTPADIPPPEAPPARAVPDDPEPEPVSVPAPPTPIDPNALGDLGVEIEGDEAIPPWDRRPLMIVIAGALVLLLIGIGAGLLSRDYFLRPGPPPQWLPGGPKPSPGASASPSAAAAPPAANGVITLSGVGDVIMGTLPASLPPNDGAGMFDPVKAALAADVVMGNLESALSESTGFVKCSTASNLCYQFYLPPRYANHLKEAGFEVMNLANNHTNDMGPTGLRNTRAALDAANVGYTGAKGEIAYVEANGVKVAVLGFSPTSGQNVKDIEGAKTLVAKAAANADLVVIQMQGGAEGQDKTHVVPGHEFFAGEDRGDLMAFSHAVIDAGADVVFGHGPHVMRGMEFYKGRLIAYSLGNFCGYKTLNSEGISGVGGVLRVTLNRDGTWVGGTLAPTVMVKGGLPEPDPQKQALTLVDGLSKADFHTAAATIDHTSGAITPAAP
jgi:poly-gamma-glutamate capsule biosynthesis protein CapA/YwtB (metallophosphatase superfamily)